MSQENLELVLELGKFFDRVGGLPESADPDALERFFQLVHPEARFEPQIAPLHGAYEGHDGVRRWLVDIAEHFTDVKMDYDDVRDVEDRVVALGTFRVKGKGSGMEIEAPLAIVVSFRDGLISALKDYGNRDEALKAVGVSQLGPG